MVPLESRSTYLQEVAGNWLLSSFNEFINRRKPHVSDELNEIDSVYSDSINSILNNDAEAFQKAYAVINRRVPQSGAQSPFVHNDFLIFVLIAGLVKFNYDKSWINQILKLKAKNSITTTFENILIDDFGSKSNNHSIAYCFAVLIRSQEVAKNLQDAAYNEIITNSHLFDDRNDIVKICSLHAFDGIILSRQITDTHRFDELIKFQTKFLKRMKITAKVIYNVLILFAVYGIYKLVGLTPALKEKANDIAIVTGLLGAGIGNYFGGFSVKIEIVLRRILGHTGVEI
ncbi:hypothetical protein ACFQZX_16110 [Mucilaginibacter litoreus]|uniref:Uncharacterized protein n=1 Tax=Mucilaginibacter litoreus TaxID=1048221 RepID=A0ABW3AX67_9SPHI